MRSASPMAAAIAWPLMAWRLGVTPAMFGELVAIVGMANETNRLADGYRVPVDGRFEKLF